MKNILLNTLFYFLWICATLIFLTIIYLIVTSNRDEAKSLLVPLGVLISAGLASVSVMKSINENKKIAKENKSFEDDRYNNLFTLRMEEMKHVFHSALFRTELFEKSDNKKQK